MYGAGVVYVDLGGNVLVCWCVGVVLVWWCVSVSVCQCVSVSVRQCVSVSVVRHPLGLMEDATLMAFSSSLGI